MYVDPYMLFCIIVVVLFGVPSIIHIMNVLRIKKVHKKLHDQYMEKLNRVIDEKQQTYPWLAEQITDFIKLQDDFVETTLRTKSHPAIKAADEIRRVSSEKRAFQREAKELQYQLNYFYTLFPWLEDFKEIPPVEGYEYVKDISDENAPEYDSIKAWLSPDEYNQLSSTDKYQRALDRYLSRKKTDWDVGIEYERYIGYLYETKGYHVTYNGAIKGLEDMGRDLIAEKGDLVHVVQCKRWKADKTIHEKHIFQLFGTTFTLQKINRDKRYRGIFVTTARVSEMAAACAKDLGIEVANVTYDPDYPKIKCNINARTKEKIYHLPMDQQYDKIVIDGKDERYVSTVEEAERLGFRRAYRWKGHLESK